MRRTLNQHSPPNPTINHSIENLTEVLYSKNLAIRWSEFSVVMILVFFRTLGNADEWVSQQQKLSARFKNYRYHSTLMTYMCCCNVLYQLNNLGTASALCTCIYLVVLGTIFPRSLQQSYGVPAMQLYAEKQEASIGK